MKINRIKYAASTLLLLRMLWSPDLHAQADTKAPPLQELASPMSATGSKVTGTGKSRNATISVKNTGKLAVTRFEMTIFFLAPDGSVGGSVPHTGSLSPALTTGKTTTVNPHTMFMKDDTASVAGAVTAVEFEDGSRWPAPPADPPAAEGDAPVGIAPAGFIGKPPLSMTSVSCFNHGKKDVSGLMYYIEFLDADGKKLGSNNYGYHGDTEDPILKSKTGVVLTGGEPLPAGTTHVQLQLTNVFFADETLWKADKSR